MHAAVASFSGTLKDKQVAEMLSEVGYLSGKWGDFVAWFQEISCLWDTGWIGGRQADLESQEKVSRQSLVALAGLLFSTALCCPLEPEQMLTERMRAGCKSSSPDTGCWPGWDSRAVPGHPRELKVWLRRDAHPHSSGIVSGVQFSGGLVAKL